jgi:meso-butanediol dehydrogenase/(S,S)-butanediol dehydrogenase/diacetyl reductase
MGRLDGRIAFISGTGRGQGRAAALLFAAEGAQVVGCDVNVDAAAETMAMVHAAGGKMTSSAPVDLADGAEAKAWIDAGVEATGGLDILYNNAAALRFGSISEMSPEAWSFTLRNELDIVFHPVQAAWPHLKRAGGTIINIASLAGWRGLRVGDQFAHGAAKAGVVGMTRHLAAEGAPHGIRVNSISPGPVITPVNPDLADPSSEMSQLINSIVPLGRAADAEEIARCALFLASDDASYITGTDLLVDGGLSAIL